MLEQTAYDVLKKKIIYGEYLPGQVLSEIALSDELGMSRTPTRSALNKLCNEGFITQKKGHFSTVRSITPKDIHNFLEFGLIIEQYALTKIYENIDEFDFSIIENANNIQLKAIEDNNKEDYYKGDHEYHMAFINYLNNEEVTKSVENIWDKVNMVTHANSNKWNVSSRIEAIKAHQEICRLLKSRAPLETIVEKVRKATNEAKKRLLLM